MKAIFNLGYPPNEGLNLKHYHLEVQANPPKKKLHTKNIATFSINGKMGLSNDFFFKFSLRPFEVVEVE